MRLYNFRTFVEKMFGLHAKVEASTKADHPIGAYASQAREMTTGLRDRSGSRRIASRSLHCCKRQMAELLVRSVKDKK